MKISAGQFKAKCLKLMDEVKSRHGEVVITKRGKPVARLVPYEETPVEIHGFMKNTITIVGDVISPLGEKWDAEN
ncbi:MAG: type II toxin-antitoxin system Phd/YefM family antitoxin [Deltaproteobacteria bacterium]|nr:type II toxin-antitoxin system Phd/YefM family antitoxin [Deltaproteobacteria bacterium]